MGRKWVQHHELLLIDGFQAVILLSYYLMQHPY